MHASYMLRISPPTGVSYTLEFSERPVADETARRLVAAFGGHANLYYIQHLGDFWDPRVSPKALDCDLVAG